MNERNIDHVVRFITAFQRGDGNSTSYYLMFEWADGGNLEDLWKEVPNPGLSETFIKKTITQFEGLAKALKSTHYEENDTSQDTGTRHGDVKPENILRFQPTDDNILGRLKLGDWGLAKYHNTATMNRKNATDTDYGTILYEPPEMKVGPVRIIGRQYDVWSMGVIFVELMIWLLYGYEELKRYRAEIRGRSDNSTPCYETIGETTQVHGVVKTWMEHMAQDPACDERKALGELLKLVRENLLVPQLSPLRGTGRTFLEAGVSKANVAKPPQNGPQNGNAALQQQLQLSITPPKPDQLTPVKTPGLRLPPPSDPPTDDIQITVTPAGEETESEPKSFRHTQVYRATSEDMVIALERILDDSDRPEDYWAPGDRKERKGPLKPLTSRNQDSSGMLIAPSAASSQASGSDRSQLAAKMENLAVGENKIVSINATAGRDWKKTEQLTSPTDRLSVLHD